MLAANGGDLLAPESVHETLLDRTTAQQRAENSMFVGDHGGRGHMMAVPAADGSTGIPEGFGWEVGTGTSWRTDPAVGIWHRSYPTGNDSTRAARGLLWTSGAPHMTL